MAIASSIIAASIIGTATAGASIYASRQQSRANDRALDAQRRANDQAIGIEREERDYDRQIDQERYQRDQERLDRLDARDREIFDITNARLTRGENFDRMQWNARAPARATGRAAMAELAKLAGLEVAGVGSDNVPLIDEAPVARPAASMGDMRSMERPTASPYRRVRDFVPMDDPIAPVGEDGVVEMRMTPEEYDQLVREWRTPTSITPTSRRRSPAALVPGGRS